MATVFDVASYIVSRCDLMTTMKLQKLVYYSYAEYAKNHNTPLFDDSFEAWRNGPVVRSLYNIHRRCYLADPDLFDASPTLEADEKKAVEIAIKKYSNYSARELSYMTHAESPWKDAREGLDITSYCEREITFEAVKRWARQDDAPVG